MRLTCELELTYSLAVSSGSLSSRSSRSRAVIIVGKKPGPTAANGRREELYVIVSTTKNVTGSKYKVKENVCKVFSKFVDEGKATVRFKEPAHQLAISKADPTQLKELLKVLKMSPSQHQSVSLAPLLPTKMQDIEKPKTKLCVKSRGDYPLKGFPASLEQFEAVGVSLNRVDTRLLHLKHLTHLDLSNNTIKSLPDTMANATTLIELRLSGNKLEIFPDTFCTGLLAENLKLLDLSRNQLKRLPNRFSQMKGLVHLKLDCNQLQILPRTFGKMSSLKYFSASSNKLIVLPASFLRLSLQSLDLFGNPFHTSGLVRRCSELSLPTLMELAGRTIKKHRLNYDPYTVPITLCHYLDSAKKCLCGTACFSAYLHYIAPLDLHRVSATVTAVDRQGNTRASVEAFLCSAKCLRLWRLNH